MTRKIEHGCCFLQEEEKMGSASWGCCSSSLPSVSNARYCALWGCWPFSQLGHAQYVGFIGGSFSNNDTTHAPSIIHSITFNSTKQCGCSYCSKNQSGTSSLWSETLCTAAAGFFFRQRREKMYISAITLIWGVLRPKAGIICGAHKRNLLGIWRVNWWHVKLVKQLRSLKKILLVGDTWRGYSSGFSLYLTSKFPRA